MMICIYDKKERDFLSNGLGILDQCQSLSILEKLNGIYELKLAYPSNAKKAVHFKAFNIIKAEGQLFRIYHVEKDSRANLIYASARHIFYDLAHYFIADRRAVDKSCKEALDLVMEEVNLTQTYSVESNIAEINTQYLIEKNAAEAVFLIVNRWQGELYRDNFHIEIKASEANDYGVNIEYGKNIQGINEKINTDKSLTAIYPIGAQGITLPEKYIINPLWSAAEYPDFKLVKKIEFPDAQDEPSLREEAQKYLDENANLNVNYQVDLIQLEHSSEYENFKSLLQVKLGDTVTVKHKLMGIDFKIKVIAVEKDILSSQNSKVELGIPLYTLDQYIEEIKDSMDNRFDNMYEQFNYIDEKFEEIDYSIEDINKKIEFLDDGPNTIVKNLSIEDNFINVVYEIEKDASHQYSAKYSFITDSAGKIESITLEEVFSELLLKEVAFIEVAADYFEVTYSDYTEAKYEYSKDSEGRIISIEKVEEEDV